MARQVLLGDGPRNHPLLKDLNLGRLGNGARGNPLVTGSLLFVSQCAGGLNRGPVVKFGDRERSNHPPDRPTFRAFDKGTGELVWEKELRAVGDANNAELVAFALPERRP